MAALESIRPWIKRERNVWAGGGDGRGEEGGGLKEGKRGGKRRRAGGGEGVLNCCLPWSLDH